jgi:branched-chain amino acid transport system ATP-binding protein
VLEVRDLEVVYGAVRAVRGLSVDVGGGDVVALLGPNGAGKTSTLRAVTALVPYGGSARFDGKEVRSLGPEGCARAGLIHVPEGRHVFPTLSVHENLQVGATAARGRTGYSFDDVYDLFPTLGPLRDRDGWALSGGEQQMVAIGRALVAAPRLLLLDEPSLGLAPIVVKAVFQALREVRERTPILVVEQNTAQALTLADRGTVLVHGDVVLQGSAAELSDRTAMLDSFLGQREIAKRG